MHRFLIRMAMPSRRSFRNYRLWPTAAPVPRTIRRRPITSKRSFHNWVLKLSIRSNSPLRLNSMVPVPCQFRIAGLQYPSGRSTAMQFHRKKIAAPGLNGALIYVGRGELNELSGKTVENAIVLMEFESGRNWLTAADLGAKALIYLDRGNSPKIFF